MSKVAQPAHRGNRWQDFPRHGRASRRGDSSPCLAMDPLVHLPETAELRLALSMLFVRKGHENARRRRLLRRLPPKPLPLFMRPRGVLYQLCVRNLSSPSPSHPGSALARGCRLLCRSGYRRRWRQRLVVGQSEQARPTDRAQQGASEGGGDGGGWGREGQKRHAVS